MRADEEMYDEPRVITAEETISHERSAEPMTEPRVTAQVVASEQPGEILFRVRVTRDGRVRVFHFYGYTWADAHRFAARKGELISIAVEKEE